MINLPPVEVKENDVCVKMLAAPINPSDINRIEGYSLFLISLLISEKLNFDNSLSGAQKMVVNLLMNMCYFIFSLSRRKWNLITIRKIC